MTSRPPAPIQLDEQIELEIEDLADGPDGLARIDGYVVLVEHALPGELISARVTSASRKFGRATPTTVLRASAERVEPLCPHFGTCGGCDLQHLQLDAQRAAKRRRLSKELTHAFGNEQAPPVHEMIGPAASWGQRHKVALQLAGEGADLIGGMLRRRSVEIVPIGDCPASDHQAFELAMTAVALLAEAGCSAWHEQYRPNGDVRAVVVRRAAGSGEAHVLIVTPPNPSRRLERIADALIAEGATAVHINQNDGPASRLLGFETFGVRGPRRIRETIGGIEYLVSADAFFQTSPAAAALAVELVCAGLAPSKRDIVADLYCGGGLFSLPLARLAGEVIGIEQSPSSFGDARASAQFNRIENVGFHRDATERALRRWRLDQHRPPSLVVLDPPRRGCGAEVAQAIARFSPRRVAYVSCDPKALGEDLVAFAAAGLRTIEVTPLDMFPHTHHIEAVAILEPTGLARRSKPPARPDEPPRERRR